MVEQIDDAIMQNNHDATMALARIEKHLSDN